MDDDIPEVSSNLFMSVAKPMSFYLRPGPIKHSLVSHITSEGGLLSSVLQPGGILLIDPSEGDCIPSVTGRSPYSPEEDEAILRFVKEHGEQTGGNQLWQKMEKLQVTSHSWQSMKYRFRQKLGRRMSEINAELTEIQNGGTSTPSKAQPRPVEKEEEKDMEVSPSLFLSNTTPSPFKEPQVQQLRRSTRRKLRVAEALDEPHRKIIRSEELMTESVRKTGESSVRKEEKENISNEWTSSQGSRGDAEQQQPVESHESTQPDEESASLVWGGHRELGVLEMATREFEDHFKSSEENVVQHKATEKKKNGPPLEKDKTQSSPGPKTLAVLGASGSPAVPSSHAAYLFIFQSGSQEADTQDSGDKTNALSTFQTSVSQLQLKEDVQEIQALMERTEKSLYCVTKALMKTSGDLCAAFHLLINPTQFSGPFWNHSDDARLFSGDPVLQYQLRDKYGETDVARRIVFLEL